MEAKISYLFDEIGKIDDKFVNEAMLVGAQKRQKRSISKALTLVAAVVLVFVLSITAIANLERAMNQSVNDDLEENKDLYENKDRLYAELTLLDAQALSAAVVNEPVENLLYNSTTRLIWTFGDGVYYSVTVRNSADEQIIQNYLRSDHTAKADPDEEFPDFKFWISFGDGKSVSPYLDRNGGRESYGILSDYLPEIYPSDAFASFIGELIREQI